MKLQVTAMMSKQKPSLRDGSQTHYQDTKKESSDQRESDTIFLFWGRNSSWISTSWPAGDQKMSSEGDARAARQWEKNTSFVEGERWLFHHDNALTHSSTVIHDSRPKHETMLVPQPPYLPDLAPAHLFLFTKLKSAMKGQRLSLSRRL